MRSIIRRKRDGVGARTLSTRLGCKVVWIHCDVDAPYEKGGRGGLGGSAISPGPGAVPLWPQLISASWPSLRGRPTAPVFFEPLGRSMLLKGNISLIAVHS